MSNTLPSRRRVLRAATILIVAVACGLTATFCCNAANWYVATNGLDANNGAINAPFATLMKAQSVARAGDTVWLRGGTYRLNGSHITATNQPWFVVNNITNSGISYLAFTNELPVFDFSAVTMTPPTNRVTAFQVLASRCVFKGFDVVGVPIVYTNVSTQSECFRVNGGNQNRFEQLRMHDGHGIGFYLTDGASNLVLNCDAFNNQGSDSSNNGNIDGFGFHSGHTTSVSNVIRGCRAWFNSDDAYDLINNKAAVLIDHCWAFYSGYQTNFANSVNGNANGFKAGGYGIAGNAYPTPVPRNTVQFCLAVRNRASGFYANHHPDGLNWINNTAYRNGTDYNLLCTTNNSSGAGDVPGFNHFMRNNLGYLGNTSVTKLDTNRCDAAFNYFNLPVSVSSNDFLSLDESLLTAPRQADGSLPYIAFGLLVGNSDLVNAGTNAGFGYTGSAPDLGYVEYGSQLPELRLSVAGTNLILTTTNGPAGGSHYLMMSTNLAAPLAQWSRMATNTFDLLNTSAATNPVNRLAGQWFYRVALP